MTNDRDESSLALLQRQRSHILFVLSNAPAGRRPEYLRWYQGTYLQEVRQAPCVVSAQHYERHEVDLTLGSFPPLPFEYLGLYEISVDGAQAAEGLIDRIGALHDRTAATWLYYPMSEKVGRSPATLPSMLTIAFANPVEGQAAEFREWYATRHIRHALNIPALVTGQCFERTLFQKPGALDPTFAMIAVYEQTGTPESIIESIASFPEGTLDFPAMHKSRFAEWVYRPL